MKSLTLAASAIALLVASPVQAASSVSTSSALLAASPALAGDPGSVSTSTASAVSNTLGVYDQNNQFVGTLVYPGTPAVEAPNPTTSAATPGILIYTYGGASYALYASSVGLTANAILYYGGAGCTGTPYLPDTTTTLLPFAYTDIAQGIWVPAPPGGSSSEVALPVRSYATPNGTCAVPSAPFVILGMPAQRITTATFVAPFTIQALH
jgi:hypothetical protein